MAILFSYYLCQLYLNNNSLLIYFHFFCNQTPHYSHYNYLIVIVGGVLVVGAIDDNSIYQHVKYQIQINNLRSEIKKYTARYQADTKLLREMRVDPKAYQKIARENYFMKADDEDIFVLSTDLPNSTNNNEEDLENETVE